MVDLVALDLSPVLVRSQLLLVITLGQSNILVKGALVRTAWNDRWLSRLYLLGGERYKEFTTKSKTQRW